MPLNVSMIDLATLIRLLIISKLLVFKRFGLGLGLTMSEYVSVKP